jgi:osmotically-inducible protein OsmY
LTIVPGTTSETEPAKTDSTLSETSKSLSQPSSATDQTPSTAAIDAATTNSLSVRSQTQTTPDLSPTSQPGTPSRIYSTNQTSTTETSDPSVASPLKMNIQGNTEMDRTLGQKVMQELRTDATLAGQISAIRLSVDNGKIALRGTVKSEDQKKSIEAAVQRVTGVASVDNQLQVSATPTGTSDADQNK